MNRMFLRRRNLYGTNTLGVDLNDDDIPSPHCQEVLDAVRECLLEHMTDEEWRVPVRVQRALCVAVSGRFLAADSELCEPDDPPVALVLTMADGTELRLTVREAVSTCAPVSRLSL